MQSNPPKGIQAPTETHLPNKKVIEAWMKGLDRLGSVPLPLSTQINPRAGVHSNRLGIILRKIRTLCSGTAKQVRQGRVPCYQQTMKPMEHLTGWISAPRRGTAAAEGVRGCCLPSPAVRPPMTRHSKA